MYNTDKVSNEYGLRDYFCNEVKNFFSDKDEVNRLFTELEIKQEVENIETNNQVDDSRTTTVINTINKASGNRNKIIVDLILSEPTWQQMMDVTFETGEDCDKKIVIYDDTWSPGYEIDSSDMAFGFARNINHYKADTYIVGARAVETKNRKKEIIYDVKEKPGENNKGRKDEAPTKEDFHQLEYALYHDINLQWEDPPLLLRPGRWFGRRSSETGPANFDYSSFWEDDGFYVGILTNYISDINMLNQIKDKGMDIIESIYKKCKIKFREESGVLSGITVRVWDRPFSDFVNSEPKEKDKLIHSGMHEHGKFSILIQEMIEVFKGGESVDFSEIKL